MLIMFDFIQYRESMPEREIETELVKNITKLLLELGTGISAVDDLMKTELDNPTIGLLLCKNKRGMIAEYSLRDIEKPIGVSEYKICADNKKTTRCG